jgi:hypothetical protein
MMRAKLVLAWHAPIVVRGRNHVAESLFLHTSSTSTFCLKETPVLRLIYQSTYRESHSASKDILCDSVKLSHVVPNFISFHLESDSLG